MTSESTKLDGNAAGGMLRQVFAFDMTQAMVTCASCQKAGPMAETVVYASPMGMIIRCPTCVDPLIRIVETPHRVWFDFSGVFVIQVAASEGLA